MYAGTKGSISDTVYNGLRSSIIELTLKPGEEIKINEIAEKLGVSRSPVRDALLRLEKEGLVDILPQIGTRVSKIDPQLMHEERFIRSALEEKTFELFLTAHTDEDLRSLKTALSLQRESLARGDYSAFLDQDDEFHRVFYLAAGKKKSWDLIRNTSGHYRRVRLLVLRAGTVREEVLAQHEELLALIAAEKNEEAMSLIKNHLSRILTEERELLAEFPDYFKPADRPVTFAAK